MYFLEQKWLFVDSNFTKYIPSVTIINTSAFQQKKIVFQVRLMNYGI